MSWGAEERWGAGLASASEGGWLCRCSGGTLVLTLRLKTSLRTREVARLALKKLLLLMGSATWRRERSEQLCFSIENAGDLSFRSDVRGEWLLHPAQLTLEQHRGLGVLTLRQLKTQV